MTKKTNEVIEKLKLEMIELFDEEGGQLVSQQGVELDLHGESLVIVSATLRNHEEYEERVQLHASFDSIEAFIEALDIESADELGEISLAHLLELYKNGKAELDEVL